jgi:hypothetical protein
VTLIRLPRHEHTCTLCHEVVDEVITNLEDPDMEVFISYNYFTLVYPILYVVFFVVAVKDIGIVLDYDSNCRVLV